MASVKNGREWRRVKIKGDAWERDISMDDNATVTVESNKA